MQNGYFENVKHEKITTICFKTTVNKKESEKFIFFDEIWGLNKIDLKDFLTAICTYTNFYPHP